MVAIRGHFDGKVIVPDEPLDLRANQQVLVTIQPVTAHAVDFRRWIGQALPDRNPSPHGRIADDVWTNQ